MIRGYAESADPTPAIDIHNDMCLYSVHTYPFLLKAIAKLFAVNEGEKVHSISVRNRFESLVVVQNSLVHMYAVSGRAESAYKLFELMPVKNLVTWNSVINGFALNARPNESLTLYRQMCLEGVEPDGFTMVSLLTSCGELGALALGRRTHAFMMKVGLIENSHAANSLLDLYAKCGNIREAQKVFDGMKEKSLVSWNLLIGGLAVNGFGLQAIELFKELERKGMVPSGITFIGVLYACSHCGMVVEGFAYFERMKEEFGIVPKIEHCGCMVDLLGRAGLVKQTYEYIKDMPLLPNAIIWRTLLGACTLHGNSDIAEVARAQLRRLEPKHCGDFVLLSNLYASERRWSEPKHCGDFVLLSNLYASERRWSDVQRVRTTMLQEGIRKVPGHTRVELGNTV